MSHENPLTAFNLLELADAIEHRRGPQLLERWRRDPLPAWRMRRQLREAFRDEWRARMDDRDSRRGRPRGQMKLIVSAFRQLDQELEAALLAASPDAMPKIAGDAIRRRVKR